MTDVVIVGAGPVGTLLSGELARRGVAVTVLERRTEPGYGSRAIGVHAPVLAALEPSGITERLLDGAVRVSRGDARSGGRTLGTVRFDRLSTRFPFVATLPQSATETALARDAPPARRGVTVTGLAAERDGIRVSTSAEVLQAPLVVLTGGWSARSLVYRPGAVAVREYRDRYLMADAAVPAGRDDGVAVVHLDRAGVLESFPLPGGRRRFVAWDQAPADDGDAVRAERLRALVRDRGEAADEVTAATSFRVRRVVAPRLRRSRLLVIGDAAHEVSPIGGQGMNLGLLDAVTLAPLLTEWVRTGAAPDAALRRWERRRVASARTAARIATLNTVLGRPSRAWADAARSVALRVALSPPVAPLVAHTYAMGFDSDA